MIQSKFCLSTFLLSFLTLKQISSGSQPSTPRELCSSWWPLLPQDRELGLSWRGNHKFNCQESSPHPFPSHLSDHSSSSIPVILNQFSQRGGAQAGQDGWEGSVWETTMFAQLRGDIKKCAPCVAPQLSLVQPTLRASCEAAGLCSSNLPPQPFLGD